MIPPPYQEAQLSVEIVRRPDWNHATCGIVELVDEALVQFAYNPSSSTRQIRHFESQAAKHTMPRLPGRSLGRESFKEGLSTSQIESAAASPQA
jgi:hypothetical protein